MLFRSRYADVKSLISDLEQFLGPKKNTHTSDIILKYLDREALINPSIQYSEISSDESFFSKIKVSWVATILLSVALGFSLGYLLKSPKTSEVSLYPAAKHIPQKNSTQLKIK